MPAFARTSVVTVLPAEADPRDKPEYGAASAEGPAIVAKHLKQFRRRGPWRLPVKPPKRAGCERDAARIRPEEGGRQAPATGGATTRSVRELEE